MILKYSINNVCFTKQLTNNSCLPNPKSAAAPIAFILTTLTPPTGAETNTFMCHKRQIIKDFRAEREGSWNWRLIIRR